ncbi:NUMOD4 domain-containing protein [Clostridium paraputrificum]|uniref:NUMOD4 domain-containing protein n=1 Tax=Clostridium paraputrificum TaxID=29363 RepID=UPI00325A5190
MKIIWKDIEGFEGYYKVSNQGDVYSCRRNIKLKQRIDSKGYKRVCLHLNGLVKDCQVHRLVAIAFIDNPNNYPIINHKDKNPLNNICNNLEWCTYKYNNNYKDRNIKLSESLKGKVTLGDKVYRKVICLSTLKEFNSIKAAAIYYGCNEKSICMVCRGQRNFSGKLKDGTKLRWMYFEKYLETLE